MHISSIQFKTVVLYGAKQTNDILGCGKNRVTKVVFLIRAITVVFVIKNQLFLKLWIFPLFCIPFVSESAFFSASANNFQMCNVSQYILNITWAFFFWITWFTDFFPKMGWRSKKKKKDYQFFFF